MMPIYYMEFFKRQKSRICLNSLDFDSCEWIFCNPFIRKCAICDFLQTFHVACYRILLLVAVYFEVHLKTMNKVSVKTCERNILSFIFFLDVALKKSSDGLILLNRSKFVITSHKRTTFLIMFLKRFYNHPFDFLMGTDIEESVVKFTGSYNSPIFLHLLKEFEQLNLCLVDKVIQIYSFL